jgi:methylated-DNA-protein-cysteine methyltransferase-like protein
MRPDARRRRRRRPRYRGAVDRERATDGALYASGVAQPTRADRIVERVRAIPEGYVRTFGDIDPGAPRLVGRVLATVHDLPWHRVVRADGSLPQGEPQRDRLVAESVPMRGDRVDLAQARVPPEF